MLKVGLYTLGCKVSLYETEAIGEAFERAGYTVSSFDEVCDVYVINTCTVTAESDAKSRKYIRRAIRKNPSAATIVIGCYGQRAPEEVAKIRGVSAVLGTQDKMKCVEIASRLLNVKSAFPVGEADGEVSAELTPSTTSWSPSLKREAEGEASVEAGIGGPSEQNEVSAELTPSTTSWSPSLKREAGGEASAGAGIGGPSEQNEASAELTPSTTSWSPSLKREAGGEVSTASDAEALASDNAPVGASIARPPVSLAFPVGEGGSRRLTDEVTTAEIRVSSLEGAIFEPMCIKTAPRTRAYVKIEDGCECKCSYCAISPARGPVRSKAPEDVISEVEQLYKNGTLEIVLTGIETGSYGADFDTKYDLADLICELDARRSCERIRLGSMAPELLNEKFIDRIADRRIMVPHFHISMQSGSDRVLRGMRRRYNSAMALKNIARIREKMTDVMLTADLMVGFPGESEEDFLDTIRFVREARLLDAHVFAYSRREGTPAADFDCQIPEQVKKERSARLIAECAAVRDEILSEVVEAEKVLSCILESERGGVYTAHSDSYIEVRVKGAPELSGTLVSVKPVSHKNGIIYGEIIDNDN